MTLRVLHHGGSWLVVDKPAGTLVIPGRGEEDAPSLREQAEAELKQKVFVVHRLDRETSGALAFALDAQAHRSLSMAFEAGRIQKTYVALVEGALEEPLDVQVALLQARKGRMRPAHGSEEGKEARTLVRPRERLGDFTLVEAEPLTGRTHQIRVHLRWAGHPLAVDPQYGRKQPLTARELGGAGAEEILARTPLHAERLVVPSLDGVAGADVRVPVPADFERAVALLRARIR